MACEVSGYVTVGVLTRNAGPILRRLGEAVFSQETERRVELVVVDSGSTDGSVDMLQAFPARVIRMECAPFHFGRARDRVFEEARGSIIISLSQDAVPAHAHWLENLVQPLDDPGVGASCGRSIPDSARQEPQFPWEHNGYFYFTREMRRFASQYGRGLSNANSAIRREVWERLRFGDARVGEDFHFQTRLANSGLRVAFPDDAPVLHHHYYTFRSLFMRCRNEGIGLRELGCPYSELDLVCDLLGPAIFVVWLRDLFRGRLTSFAALAFPVLRPAAVYVGSRFGRECVWD